MDFTPQAILDLQKGFSTLFEKGRNDESVPVLWEQKAERIDTPGIEINVYGWLAEFPMFRKWIGSRIAKRLAARNHQIKNEPYEFSYSIGRDDIKYDRFGLYSAHYRHAGIAARVIWDQILTIVQLAGKTVKCYDGQFFYDTDHPTNVDDPNSPQFPNLFTGRSPTPSNIAFVYDAMASLKDANGEPMLSRPNILEFGAGLRDQVMASLSADIIASVIKNVAATENVAAAGISNNLKSLLLTPMQNDRLPAGVWFLHSTGMMKPFVVQVETAPTGLEARVNAEDPHVWENNEFLFGSRACGGAGYGLPQLSARVEV
jgi:phage major head subunit gpT-like protein